MNFNNNNKLCVCVCVDSSYAKRDSLVRVRACLHTYDHINVDFANHFNNDESMPYV